MYKVTSSYSTNVTLPSQRVSASEKSSAKWYVPTIEYWIKEALSKNDKKKVTDWLNYASGIIDTQSYMKAILPFTKDDDIKLDDFLDKFPDEFYASDFITPAKEMAVGDYMSLPYNPQTMTNDSEAFLLRDKELKEQLSVMIQKMYIDMLNARQESGDEAIPELPSIDQFYKDFIKSWSDKRAIDGGKILKLINDEFNFDLLRIETFIHWWSTEQFFVFRNIDGNRVTKQVIDPRFAYPIDNGARFAEDYDGFVIRDKVSLGVFKDLYMDMLSDEDRDMLEKYVYTVHNTNGIVGSIPSTIINLRDVAVPLKSLYGDAGDIIINPNNTIDRCIVIFKTEEPYYMLTRINSLEELESIEVGDDYEIDVEHGDIELKKYWKQVVMLAYRFGVGVSSIYTKPIRCPIQQYDEDTNTCKLPIGGKIGLVPGLRLKPIPERLVINQAIDRLYQFMIDKEIAKYKSFMELIPKSMLMADDMGTAKEKFLYRLLDGSIIYDDGKVDIQTIIQGYRIVEGGNIFNYLRTLMDLKKMNREEAQIYSHMNSDRMGNVDTRAGVGNVSTNIARAKLGTALMVVMFNAAWLREHVADLEYSKLAYAQGKVGHFTDSSGKLILVDVNTEKHLNTKYVIALENSIISEQKLAQYKQLAFGAAQNGDYDIATLAIDSDNRIEIREALLSIVKARKEFEQSSQQNNLAQQQQLAEKQEAIKMAELELKGAIAQYQQEGENYRTQLKVNASTASSANVDNALNSINKITTDLERLRLDRDKLNATVEQGRNTINLKREEMRNNVRIAKMNKN